MNFEAVELRKLTFKKNALGGFRQTDVNDFLRNVADDYETYDERIRRLIEDKDKLEADLRSKELTKQRLTTQQEQERQELLQKIQQMTSELKQLKAKKEEWDSFTQLQLDYQDVSKMKRIAQQTLEAAEKAANKLLEEAERKKNEVLTMAEQQKTSLLTEAEKQKQDLLNKAEEERLQYLFNAKLEISALEREQDERETALEERQNLIDRKHQELLELKATIHEEVKTFSGMMTATRQEISQEYTKSIEALTQQNEAIRKNSQQESQPTIHVLEQEKEVM